MVGVERVVGVDRVGVDQVDAAADTDPLSKVLGASRAIHNVQHLLLRIGTLETRQKLSNQSTSTCFNLLKKTSRHHIEDKASQIPRQITVLSVLSAQPVLRSLMVTVFFLRQRFDNG